MNWKTSISPKRFSTLSNPFYRYYMRKYGTFREKENLRLINRPQFAYGLLRAADIAQFFGKKG